MNRRVDYDHRGRPRITYAGDQVLHQGYLGERPPDQTPMQKSLAFFMGGFALGLLAVLGLIAVSMLVMAAVALFGASGLVLLGGAVGSFIGARKGAR